VHPYVLLLLLLPQPVLGAVQKFSEVSILVFFLDKVTGEKAFGICTTRAVLFARVVVMTSTVGATSPQANEHMSRKMRHLCVCVCVCVCVFVSMRVGVGVGVWVCVCVGVWVCGCVCITRTQERTTSLG
jgi:uncharacterized membrane protein